MLLEPLAQGPSSACRRHGMHLVLGRIRVRVFEAAEPLAESPVESSVESPVEPPAEPPAKPPVELPAIQEYDRQAAPR